MRRPSPIRAHLVVGGFPPGSPAAHDMDYARRRLLGLLGERDDVLASVASDLADLERWLGSTRLLVTYLAGPCLEDAQCAAVEAWLADGGRWLALHGSSGGRAARVDGNAFARRMVRQRHHDTLGAFFLNHPPVRRFRVDVAESAHPLCRGLPASFEVADELYLVELCDPANSRVLLTTSIEKDPSPDGFGFLYDRDTSALEDGHTRVLGYERTVGQGGVVYVALGHCHSPLTNAQPFVDASVSPDGKTPLEFRGAWETEAFERLLRNGLDQGLGGAASA